MTSIKLPSDSETQAQKVNNVATEGLDSTKLINKKKYIHIHIYIYILVNEYAYVRQNHVYTVTITIDSALNTARGV